MNTAKQITTNRLELLADVLKVQGPEAMFRHIDTHLAHYPDVGAYNQKIA